MPALSVEAWQSAAESVLNLPKIGIWKGRMLGQVRKKKGTLFKTPNVRGQTWGRLKKKKNFEHFLSPWGKETGEV